MSFGREPKLSLLSAEGSGLPQVAHDTDSVVSFSPPRHRRPRTQLSQDAGFTSGSLLKRSPSDSRLHTHYNPGERLSTLYSNSSFMDSRTLSYPIFPGAVSEGTEGSTFDHFRYEQSVRASGHWGMGMYPVRAYCVVCKCEVGTQVSTRLAEELPSFLQFLSDFIHCCRHSTDSTPKQEIVHSCVRCKRVLARVILE